MTTPETPVYVKNAGRVSFETALEWQRGCVERRVAGEIGDQLLLVEHDPVITVGRGARVQDVSGVPYPVVEVERGGEATFHGPGQIVGYPILALAPDERDLHRYLRGLEEVLIGAIGDFGVEADRRPPHTGVWIGERKVASIGVAVRRWVTLHGFALNVRTDLSGFRGFRPCGLDSAVMATLEELYPAAFGREDLEELRARIIRRFGEVFRRRPVIESAESTRIDAWK